MRNKAHFVFFKESTTSFGVDFTTRNRCDLFFLFFYWFVRKVIQTVISHNYIYMFKGNFGWQTVLCRFLSFIYCVEQNEAWLNNLLLLFATISQALFQPTSNVLNKQFAKFEAKRTRVFGLKMSRKLLKIMASDTY